MTVLPLGTGKIGWVSAFPGVSVVSKLCALVIKMAHIFILGSRR
ncbi:MAG: hypothetical protein J07HQW1_03176 [Haloquadratum walsbyi J07HQW1]|uniref:Uncharacterized protein n=1 Tax=Haloquadratum walsbyi J07HQW1 TaxID=1238424 RepID=U1MSF8_9EURY|nr:MAG: hypothetical protein J07HQW1_03176 [Haloquadratum walsbyi J07HQW1]